MLVCSRLLSINRIQIVDCGAQSYLRSDCRRSRLKLIWQISVDSLFKRNALDHVTTALKRIHLFEYLSLAVNDSAASGSEHLVTREGVKVAVEILNIDQHMRSALRAIDQNRHAVLVRLIDHFLDWVYSPQRI